MHAYIHLVLFCSVKSLPNLTYYRTKFNVKKKFQERLTRIIQCNIVCVYSSLNEGNENVSSLAKVNGGVKKRINISF